jgi:class 3 adenylate cyclase
VEPDYVFCLDCGASLQAGARSTPTAAPPPPAAAPDVTVTAERRLVSVLFADLVGFTALSEGHDAEEVRDDGRSTARISVVGEAMGARPQ